MSFRIRRFNRRSSPARRSFSTGCLFAFFLIGALALLLSRSNLRVPAVNLTPQELLTGRMPVDPPDLPSPTDPTTAVPTATSEPESSPSEGAPTIPTGVSRPVASPAPPTLPTEMHLSQSVPVSDLVFLDDDDFYRWDRRHNRAALLSENIADFAVSANGSTALVLLPLPITANGFQRFNLELVQLETGEKQTLLAETPKPQKLVISANGAAGAYYLQGERTLVYLLETLLDEEPKLVGACEEASAESCLSLALTPDGRSLAWSDGRGIWIYDPSNRKTRLVHDPQVEITDPEGQVGLYSAAFFNLRWSTDGRFLLVRSVPANSPVGWESVIDVRTGAMAHIPDSFTQGADEARAEWYAPGQVLVTHAGDPARGEPPFIHLWNVIATNPRILVSDRRYDLYSDDFPFSSESSKAIPAHGVSWVAPGPPGKLLLVITLPDTAAGPVLFLLDLLLGKLTKIRELPTSVVDVAWSPDGSGGMVSIRGGSLYFLHLSTGNLIDLRTVIDLEPRRVHWLAPSLPKKGAP